MQDDRGVYYYPNPAQKTTRMYVREQDGALEFRLFSNEEPGIWERHQWLPLSVIQEAARQYSGDKDPMLLYDAQVAREVLRQARHKDK